MKRFFLFILPLTLLYSCSSYKKLHYINNSSENNDWNAYKTNFLDEKLNSGDILSIEVKTLIPEASIPYNNISRYAQTSTNIDVMRLEGYLIDQNNYINFPVLGKINTKNLTIQDLENNIFNLLIDGNHLADPTIVVRRLNSKFTVLGEVLNPGTFSYFDDKVNIFQALGYAGDLTIDGKRKITVIREQNKLKKVYEIELNSSDILNSPIYQIRNNDVIIVNPSFSKVKSAGFIGSPSSIASMASLLLSITLLILNK